MQPRSRPVRLGPTAIEEISSKPFASLRAALRAETKSQMRARLDEATSTIHWPRARPLQARLRRAACASRSKLCRRPLNAAPADALESATDRRDSVQPVSR